MSLSTRRIVRLAVLVDAENISPKYVGPLLEEVARFGTATARRIYGDWTQPQHARWRNLLNAHALIPVQQFRLTAGKNGTDCALIIDAMDLLHSGHFDGFCIVSSDSDFTRLACRIRESGLVVYGFGESKTPASFVNSCDRFVTLELLALPADDPDDRVSAPGPMAPEVGKPRMNEAGSNDGGLPLATTGTTPVATPKDPAPPARGSTQKRATKQDRGLTNLVMSAYKSVAGEDGWAPLANFGTQMLKLSPSFDPRSYGHSKLGDLVVALGLFEVKKVPSPKSPVSSSWFIKAK